MENSLHFDSAMLMKMKIAKKKLLQINNLKTRLCYRKQNFN